MHSNYLEEKKKEEKRERKSFHELLLLRVLKDIEIPLGIYILYQIHNFESAHI